MKEIASFYSQFLARSVLVVLEDGVVQRVALESHARRKDPPSSTRPVKALERYLEGKHVDLSIFPVELGNRSVFERATLECTQQIPRGCVVTYSQLAAQVGHPRAARAVGNALRRNPVPLFVPCHRVVGAAGLGGFSWGLETKRKLLHLENVRSLN